MNSSKYILDFRFDEGKKKRINQSFNKFIEMLNERYGLLRIPCIRKPNSGEEKLTIGPE